MTYLLRLVTLLSLAILAFSCSCGKSKDKSSNSEAPANPNTSNPDTQLTAPLNLLDGTTSSSLSESPSITWDAVDGAVSYEVAIGTTAGGTNTLDWTSVDTNLSYTATSLILLPSTTYYASVRAKDSSDQLSLVSEGDGWSIGAFTCPTNYILIPGNTTAGLGGTVYTSGTQTRSDGSARSISNFCVMKYEAKLEIDGAIQADGDNPTDEIDLTAGVVMNDGVVETTPGGLVVKPVSSATGKPWVYPERTADDDVVGAEGLCSSLGPDYALINNSQWQAIARDIESVTANYDTSGAAADETFNHGHADDDAGSPGGVNSTGALAADSDDNNACVGISNETSGVTGAISITCAGGWHINKRTHELSNAEVIWDLSGNVYEWVLDDQPLSSQGADGFIHLGTAYSSALKWAPVNDYSSQSGVLTKGGLGYFWDGSAGAVIRGATWSLGSAAGLFAAYLVNGSSNSTSSIGFRCVYAP